jgi:hypothetical protein
MSNHIWTADGRIMEIDVANRKTENVKNIIEPFTLFDLKEDVQPKNLEEKKIIFVKPNSNKTLNNLCFYRNVYSDGTFGDYNNPPLIEITGTKCSPNESKNSFGMRINNIRSVNNLKGSGTLVDKDGMKCELNRKNINDSYLNSLYFGDCLSDPTYWSEETDEKKINEYNKKLKSEKLSDYIPKLKLPEQIEKYPTTKYPNKLKTILEIDPTFKNHIQNNDQKDWLATILHTDSCLGGTSDVEKQNKSNNLFNNLKSVFKTDIDTDKVSGREGIHVNLYGNKCPENSNAYFGMDVQLMETTDSKGNVRTFKMPTTSEIKMNYGKPEILNYDKDEKCQVDLTTISPVLKNVLVGDCNNPPIAFRKIKALDNTKENNIQVYDDVKYKTQQISRPTRRPGLAGYDVNLSPQCNSKGKVSFELKKMVDKCGNNSQ